MSTAFSIALSGLQNAAASFAAGAARVAAAQTPGGTTDLAADFVNMTMAKNDFRADVAVLSTSDKMMGALLDILA